MNLKAESAFIDILIEVGLLLFVYCISFHFGLLTFDSTCYNEFFAKLSLSTFCLWGLIFIISNNWWRRRTVWLSAFLFLLSPQIGELLFISRLLALNSLTVKVARFLGFGLLIIQFLNPMALAASFLFGPAHIDESRVKVGNIFVNQYVEEYSLRSKSVVVLQKQIPLIGKFFMTSYIFDVPNEFELLDLKVVDTKTIEIEFDGKPMRIKVN